MPIGVLKNLNRKTIHKMAAVVNFVRVTSDEGFQKERDLSL